MEEQIKVEVKVKKHPGGRPPVIDDLKLKKLEEAFATGCTDEEACSYADIAPKTLYNYQNANPEFLQRKELLKQKPFLKARKTIMNSLDSVQGAQWFAERKMKNEFSTRQELVGADGSGIKINIIDYERSNFASQLRSKRKAVPAGNPPEQLPVQVSEDSSEGGQDSPIDK